MDKFEKRWIRREFNKTNGMIFLYKILFGQLTFLIMMAMYRLLTNILMTELSGI
jgi:hypothetical protein